MADPNDTAARQKKAAENPLVSYFSGQPSQKAPQAAAAQAPAAPPPAANQTAAQPRSTNVGQQAVTNMAPQQGQQVQPGQAKPATGAGGFTNYAQYFNANKDAAGRTSAAIAGQTALKAAQARKALEDQQAKFSQDVAAGTVGAYDAGTHQQLADPNGIEPGTQHEVANTQMSTDALAAQGQRAYTGPGGLGDEAGIAGAYDKANAAQQNLNALGAEGGVQALIQGDNPQGNAGTSRFSAGLVGEAGRGAFDALRAHFNPQQELDAAAKASGAQSDAAKALSAKNADEWARQAGVQGTAEANAQALQQQKSQADAAALSAASQKALSTLPPAGQESNVMAGLTPGTPEYKQRGAELDAFNAATKTNTGDDARDVLNALSPSQGISEAIGNRNPLGDYFTGTYHPGEGSASGSTHGDHIPWGQATSNPTQAFWVYRQMTPAQWQEINSLPHNGQKEWIAKRLQQIRAKQDGKPIPGGNNWPKSGGE